MRGFSAKLGFPDNNDIRITFAVSYQLSQKNSVSAAESMRTQHACSQVVKYVYFTTYSMSVSRTLDKVGEQVKGRGFENRCGAGFGARVSVPKLNMVSATPSNSVSDTFS